jgi:dihydroorotase
VRTLIKNGRVIDPASGLDTQTSIAIDDDRILSIGDVPADFEADETIDASGHWVIPGLVDIGARLREPGQEHKGTIASETRAAAAAGICHIACLPDTDPVIDAPAEVDFILQQAEEAGNCQVHVIGALTTGLEGLVLSGMASMKQAGCIGVAQCLAPMKDLRVLRNAMEYASSQGLTVFFQPQEFSLAKDGCAHEGPIASRLGLRTIPEAAETAALGNLLALVEQTGARTHFCRMSSAHGVNMIRRARHDGLPVSADVSAHQLFLTEMDISDFNTLCHVLPPLRSERDMNALRDGVRDGTLLAICSDHQPHEQDAKLAPFPASEPGISGLETLLPLTLKLVQSGVIDAITAIERLTVGPAQVLDIDAGRLETGRLANICILDPEQEWTFDTDNMLSSGKNSPFEGWSFTGRAVRTLFEGETIFQ